MGDYQNDPSLRKLDNFKDQYTIELHLLRVFKQVTFAIKYWVIFSFLAGPIVLFWIETEVKVPK